MARVPPGIGLIETMRVVDGTIPWLERHLARLQASITALDLTPPREALRDLLRNAAGDGDHVVRIEVRDGHAEIATRAVNQGQAPSIVISDEVHAFYPHKTTSRAQFGRALATARRLGADDAVLFTQAGHAVEGTSWNLFWWEKQALCTPATSLGMLPGIGRGRVMELRSVQEVRATASELVGRSLFLVNAVRGIVEIGTFERRVVPNDPRTAELSSAFWPD